MGIREHIDKYLNYWIIGIVSLVALFFLPFVGSEAGLELVLPNTTAGWIVYVGTKLVIAAINVLLFHCFFQQSKINVKDEPRYIEALTILDKLRVKEMKFISPEEYTRHAYRSKGTTAFFTTILGAVSLTQAILNFNLIMFLTYFFTILMGIIFGILNMKSAEIYWTDGMWHYAKKQQELAAEKAKAAESEDKQCL